MAYHEFAFELEPETCKCQSSSVRPISNDDKTMVARHDIRRIVCGMLDGLSSNSGPLNDRVIGQLLKVMEKLDETDSSEHGMPPNELRDLVEEHGFVAFNETVIKKRLLEIVENTLENDNNGNRLNDFFLSYRFTTLNYDFSEMSFDQMAAEIENNSRRVLERSSKIKNVILAMNPSTDTSPDTTKHEVFACAVKFDDKNSANIIQKNSFQLKSK